MARRDSARSPPKRQTTGADTSAAEGRDDAHGGGAQRQDEDGSQHDPRPTMREVERGAVAGDLGHPESRIARVVVDDAVPSFPTAERSGAPEPAMHRLERPGCAHRGEHDDADSRRYDLAWA